MDEEIFAIINSPASSDIPARYSEMESRFVNPNDSSLLGFIEKIKKSNSFSDIVSNLCRKPGEKRSFFGSNSNEWMTTNKSFDEELEGKERLENSKAFHLPAKIYGERKSRDLQVILDNLISFEVKSEPEIIEKIKAKINLNKEEKKTINGVFSDLKHLRDFDNVFIGTINEISKNYLDKYFAFAHENFVAMKFTEAILYSLCSRECRFLVVPRNYFLKYFNENYSSKIQICALVANSFVEKEFNEKSSADFILFVLGIWKGLDTKEEKSDANFLCFSEKEITNSLYMEVSRLAWFITKCQESIYTILCQLLEGINLMDSSQIFQLPLAIMDIFNSTYKSKIFQCQFNPNKFQEEDRLALNCFYVSINILSKCCQASADIPFDEMNLLETFEEFSHFISSNIICQRICESLLYCICNVVDKREIRYKGFSNFKIFEEIFLDPKVSTEIKLTSSFILSYLYLDEEKGIKSNVLEYLESILTYPEMKLHQTYCGFSEEEIQNCIGLLMNDNFQGHSVRIFQIPHPYRKSKRNNNKINYLSKSHLIQKHTPTHTLRSGIIKK